MFNTWINSHLISVIVFMPLLLLLGLILLLLPKKHSLLTKIVGLFGAIIHTVFTASKLLQLNSNSIGQIYTEHSPWVTAVDLSVDY